MWRRVISRHPRNFETVYNVHGVFQQWWKATYVKKRAKRFDSVRGLALQHVAACLWANGVVEIMNPEDAFWAVLYERRRPESRWPLVMETVQWALNSAFREQIEIHFIL